MQSAPADVERAVARLTAKAAPPASIFIVATRPAREIVTGIIRPISGAHRVSGASGLDSRVILDENGAKICRQGRSPLSSARCGPSHPRPGRFRLRRGSAAVVKFAGDQAEPNSSRNPHKLSGKTRRT